MESKRMNLAGSEQAWKETSSIPVLGVIITIIFHLFLYTIQYKGYSFFQIDTFWFSHEQLSLFHLLTLSPVAQSPIINFPNSMSLKIGVSLSLGCWFSRILITDHGVSVGHVSPQVKVTSSVHDFTSTGDLTSAIKTPSSTIKICRLS